MKGQTSGRRPRTLREAQIVIDQQAAVITELRATVRRLEAKITALEARLDADSHNSGKPPSSDGLRKAPAFPRERGARNPGKQPGAPGAHLAMVAEPDEVVTWTATHCGGCGHSLRSAALVDEQRRQVYDIPETRLLVTEHRAEVLRCACGQETVAAFPEGVSASTQYGPNVKALAVMLAVQQHLPIRRVAEVLHDTLGTEIAEGSIERWIGSTAAGPVVMAHQAIAAKLRQAALLHVDETGVRVAGQLHWIHSASTTRATHYHVHKRRGREGIAAAGIVPGFSGTVVRDGYQPYWDMTAGEHALCNAHHLRELRALHERGHGWTGTMIQVLLDANRQVHEARGAPLPGAQRAVITRRYRAALHDGERFIRHRRADPLGNRRARNLLRRLQGYEAETLRFCREPGVPFTNNQAERDIRMAKLQQKISGGFRTEHGAASWLTIRGYLSTCRKNGITALQGLRLALDGRPFIPATV